MKTKPSQFNHLASFQSREVIEGAFGQSEGALTPRFELPVKLQPKRGGEAVLAARMTGKAVYICTVERTADTEMLTSDWCLEIDRSLFEIKEPPVLSENGFYFEFLIEGGHAV